MSSPDKLSHGETKELTAFQDAEVNELLGAGIGIITFVVPKNSIMRLPGTRNGIIGTAMYMVGERLAEDDALVTYLLSSDSELLRREIRWQVEIAIGRKVFFLLERPYRQERLPDLIQALVDWESQYNGVDIMVGTSDDFRVLQIKVAYDAEEHCCLKLQASLSRALSGFRRP